MNGTFLDRIAVQNHGLSEYVLPTDDLEAKVPGFYSRMQSPLVLDTRIELVGGGVHDVYPREIGDLYGGHQILITGRYRKPGKAELVISGRRGGEPFELRVPVTLAPGARIGDQEVVARIWAARKVGYLVDEVRLNGESKEVVDEIVRLGTRFGILTEYTSFLAAEETDLLAFEANGRRAGLELLDRSKEESGAHGVAQAANSKSRQRAQTAETENGWYDENGRPTIVAGVQCVNGKSLFKRGDAWLDAVVPEGIEAKDVTLFSEPFFSMLDANPWLNRVVSRTGSLICEVNGEYVRFLQPSGD